jgi:hypothetical protein
LSNRSIANTTAACKGDPEMESHQLPPEKQAVSAVNQQASSLTTIWFETDL